MEPFEEFGNWWLPESGEEASCGGTVSFGFDEDLGNSSDPLTEIPQLSAEVVCC